MVEHHIGVYAGNGNDTKIIRGEAPKRLLNHSILTPSLAASVFTAKCVDAVPAELFSSHLIHCDGSPFKMTGEKEAGDPQSKDYMWVYHSPEQSNCHPVYLYEYANGSRAGYVIREYLKGYTGVLVTDGYQSYHTLQKERPDDIRVAGCWAYARRKFADIIKAADDKKAKISGQKVAE